MILQHQIIDTSISKKGLICLNLEFLVKLHQAFLNTIAFTLKNIQ